MNFTYRIGRACAADSQGGHIEHRPEAIVVMPELQKLVSVGTRVRPIPRKVGVHKINAECVMSGSDRSMRCKDRGAAYFLKSRLEALATIHPLTHSLEGYKCRVPLVQMPDHRLMTQSSQCANTANAEYNLLLESCFAVAAIKSR